MTLLVIGLVNAAAAAYYYLSILKACYLDDGEFIAEVRTEGTRPQATGIILASVLTILLGVMPAILVKPLNSASPVKQNASQTQTDLEKNRIDNTVDLSAVNATAIR